MTKNVTSDDLHDHNYDFSLCHVTFQKKGNDFSIRPLEYFRPIEGHLT